MFNGIFLTNTTGRCFFFFFFKKKKSVHELPALKSQNDLTGKLEVVPRNSNFAINC